MGGVKKNIGLAVPNSRSGTCLKRIPYLTYDQKVSFDMQSNSNPWLMVKQYI